MSPKNALKHLLLLCLLTGCVNHSEESEKNQSVRVQLPMEQAGGKYQLQIVELFSLQNFAELKGLAAHFLMQPGFKNTRLVGARPRMQYLRNHHGDYIPTDSLSIQLASLYYQFEQLHDLDKSLGVDTVNTWPQTVAVNPNLNGNPTDNALYSGELDAFLFLPYTEDNMPLTVNSGVVAHEHFHSLFFKKVIQKSNPKLFGMGNMTAHDMSGFNEIIGDDQKIEDVAAVTKTTDVRTLYHVVLFRGLNEGLADVWGWIFSGDADFIKRSIPAIKESRNLEGAITTFPSIESVKSCINDRGASPDSSLGDSYAYGTQFARQIKIYMGEYNKENNLSEASGKKVLAQNLMKSLDQLAASVKALDDKAYYDPLQFLRILYANIPLQNNKSTQMLSLLDSTRNSACTIPRSLR